jgi:hypothetical protein
MNTGLGKYTENGEAFVVGWDYVGGGDTSADVRLYLGVDGDYFVARDFRNAALVNNLASAYRYLEAAKKIQPRENFSSHPEFYQVGIFAVKGILLEEVKVSDALAAAVEKVKSNLDRDEVAALRNYLRAGGEI